MDPLTTALVALAASLLSDRQQVYGEQRESGYDPDDFDAEYASDFLRHLPSLGTLYREGLGSDHHWVDSPLSESELRSRLLSVASWGHPVSRYQECPLSPGECLTIRSADGAIFQLRVEGWSTTCEEAYPIGGAPEGGEVVARQWRGDLQAAGWEIIGEDSLSNGYITWMLARWPRRDVLPSVLDRIRQSLELEQRDLPLPAVVPSWPRIDLERAEEIRRLASMSDEELFAIPTDVLDRVAWGLSDAPPVQVPLSEIIVVHDADLDNAIYAVSRQPGRWVPFLDEPVEIDLKEGRYVLQDGHHRYVTAKNRGDDFLLATVSPKDNPILAIRALAEIL